MDSPMQSWGEQWPNIFFYIFTKMCKISIAEPVLRHRKSIILFIVTIVLTSLLYYKGADKSLAQPERKHAIFPAFYGTWKFITTFTTAQHLSLP